MFCDEQSRRPADTSASQDFILQPLVLSTPSLERDLYYKAIGFLEPMELGDVLFLEAGSAIDCDTLINAFFSWHWHREAQCGATKLIVEASGEGDVHLHAISRFGRTQIASKRLHTGVNWIPIPQSSTSIGRLACSFGGRAQGLSIQNAYWACDVAPRRRVNVNIVICTFNKVTALASSLERLCYGRPADIGRIIVVDQGDDRIEDALGIHASAALKAGSLSIFRQPNLGGSGGFARGIYETLQDDRAEGCTDVLLMDDDVFFDPRLLDRYVALLQRLPTDTMIGGSMLDMVRPHHLFAFTERFDFETGHVERQHPHGLDMRRKKSLSKLEDAIDGNYNGWFLCSIPRNACAMHGLPLPFFVRTDDCEYGVRLTSAGVPIGHMPGFFVWHEPFWQKRRAWIEYYTFRNHYILATLKSQNPSKALICRRLGEFWHYVATYQYSLALAACVAFEHYLEGPDKLFVDVLARHSAIMPMFADFERNVRGGHHCSVIRAVDCPPQGGKPKSSFHPALPQAFRLLANIFWTLRSKSRQTDEPVAVAFQAVRYTNVGWEAFHEFPCVIIDMPDGSSESLHIDTAVARSLVKRMLRATAIIFIRRKSLHSAYQQSFSHYATLQYWSTIFRS